MDLGIFVEDYLARVETMVRDLDRAIIQQVIDVLYHAWQDGQQIFVMGNGGSAATASHFANDMNKLTVVPGKPRMKMISLSDNMPLITAWANDLDYAEVFAEQLLNFVQPGDIVIAISTSGNSKNVLRALEVAKKYQTVTIGFTGNKGGKLKELVDYCIFVPDDHTGRQEDGHMILDHVISNGLKALIQG
jgi:D-sedoheptulose 7-phosphate isomerase